MDPETEKGTLGEKEQNANRVWNPVNNKATVPAH